MLIFTGSVWTKASLTTVFETIIKKSREILQTAFLFLTTPVFEFLCATIVWLVDVLSKLSGVKITPIVEVNINIFFLKKPKINLIK